MREIDCLGTNGDCQTTARVVLHRQLQPIFLVTRQKANAA